MKQLLLLFFGLISLSAIAGNIIVQNGNDAGTGSLRQAIADAKDGDIITFSKAITIFLTSGELVISKNITIEGKRSTLKGSFSPLIKAEVGNKILLKNLVFWEDIAKPRGAILNLTRNLTLEACILVTNKELSGRKILLRTKLGDPKTKGLQYQPTGTNVETANFNGGDGGGSGGGCTVFPDQPDLYYNPPACGTSSVTVSIDYPVGEDIQYRIITQGSVNVTTTTSSNFSLNVGSVYTIYAQQISSTCLSQNGTEVDLSSPTTLHAPVLNVIKPACGSGTGTVTVTSPLGADYEYSNNGGAFYQPDPAFTISAGAPYSITFHKISTGCISIAAGGTMSLSRPLPVLYVNANATGSNNGTSWANAYKNLQDALANSGGCVTQIWVAKGTYYPDQGGGATPGDRNAAFAMQNNLAIYGGFAGTESSLNDRNLKINKTILSGDIDQNDGADFLNADNNSYSVIKNQASFGSPNIDNTAIIDGFVITGGNDGDGGGMYNQLASPSVLNCVFKANQGNYGGGMMNANAEPIVTNCTFTGNYSQLGGAMANGFAINTTAPVVTNCTFAGNYGINNQAAIYNDNAATLISNCVLWGNGSGITSNSVSGPPDPNVTYCIIQGGYPGTGNLDIDPLFVDAANGDLHLQACSPAIDAGDDAANSSSTDLDGNDRKFDAKPGGNIIDMGAYEYNGNTPTFYRDSDGDGYGDPNVSTSVCPAPAGYVANNTDCDDGNKAINPATIWYKDADNDGYSDGATLTQCTRPTKYKLASELTATSGDCDDDNAAINPATVWYKDSDNDGYSDGTTAIQCTRPTGDKLASELTATSGDCDDNDPAINPTTTWLFDYDNDGYYSSQYIGVASCTAPGPGWKPASSFTKGVDCDDNDPLVTTGRVWYKDADNDGYSDGTTKTQCDQPTGYKLAANLTATSGDCNDDDATVNPQTVWVLDADNDGYYIGTPVTQCSSPGTGYVVFTAQVSGDCNDNDANVHTSSTMSIQPGVTTCSGSTATITASSSATNPTYSWYADAADQNLLQQSTSASFTTPVLTGNTIFYVSVADGSAGCTSALTQAPVTVNPLPLVVAITYSGSTTVCSASTVTLSDATPGGTWSTSNNAASVSTAGVVNFATVTAATSVTISYRVISNGCSKAVGIIFTVSPPISVKAITGATSICGTGTTTLSDATGGGTWSSNNTAVATVSSTGVVTGKSAGSALITYTVSSGGCTASVSTAVTVNALPTITAISGTGVLIKGTSSTLTDATKGGTWSSSNTAIATVSAGGSVKGISAGTCTIYYIVSSGGCSAMASKPVTVYNPLSASVTAGKISCNGSTTTLTINVTGGSGGYQYSLNGGKFQTGNTYTVNAGTYLVVVKDNMAEQFTISSIIISQPAALAVKLTKETNASSKTAANGSFIVSGSGGTPGYQYSRNGGSTYQASGTFSSLAPGTYNVSIKDANNCVALNKLSVTVGYGGHLSLDQAMPEITNSDEILATISPNPAETEFKLTLSGSSNKEVELRVIDMYGRVVYNATGSGNQTYRFGERFTSGMYIVEILQGKSVKNLKIIKAK